MDARLTTRERRRAILQLLAGLAVCEPVYLFLVFDSHAGNSTVRWLAGFWLQVLIAVCVLALMLRARVKGRKRSGESTPPD